MAKPSKSSKLTSSKAKKLRTNVEEIIIHYEKVLSIWNELSKEQKTYFLSNSPVLSNLLDWSDQWLQGLQ